MVAVRNLEVVPNTREMMLSPRTTTSCGCSGSLASPAPAALCTCWAVRLARSRGRSSSRSLPCAVASVCGALAAHVSTGPLSS